MPSDLGSAEQRVKAPASSPEEDHKAEVLQRYQALVEQKYLRGLASAEQAEMEALGQEIDGFYDEFYEPILADLRQRLKNQTPGG